MSLLMTHLKRHKKSLMALLRLYAAAASMTERNGCKPSQKVFELTILGVCNRYLKKKDCGCRDYEKCQFPYEPSHICRADTGCRK